MVASGVHVVIDRVFPMTLQKVSDRKYHIVYGGQFVKNNTSFSGNNIFMGHHHVITIYLLLHYCHAIKIKEAHNYVASGKACGKVVIRIQPAGIIAVTSTHQCQKAE